MEYIDIINIVNDAWLATSKLVKHEMKKNLRKIELSNDKEGTIKNIIAALRYEDSLAGIAYINENYVIGNNFIEIREILSNFYYGSDFISKHINENDRLRFIDDDVRDFLLLLLQEIELRKLMHPQHHEDYIQYSKTLSYIFLDDTQVIDIFFSRIQSKKGVKVVNEIIALRELGKMRLGHEITNKCLFDEITKVGPIGGISSFNSAFDLGTNSKQKNKRRIEIEEAKKAYQ